MLCSAHSCANTISGQASRQYFRFPVDKRQRKKWLINLKRRAWTPGPGARLCEDHFEESQFEVNRANGCKRLKKTAIPTIFSFAEPPHKRQRCVGSRNRKTSSETEGKLVSTQAKYAGGSTKSSESLKTVSELDPNKTGIGISQLFEDPDTIIEAQATVISFLKQLNIDYFKLLKYSQTQRVKLLDYIGEIQGELDDLRVEHRKLLECVSKLHP